MRFLPLQRHVIDVITRLLWIDLCFPRSILFTNVQVAGSADQKGSLVDHNRLRFDFTSKKGLTVEQLRRKSKKRGQRSVTDDSRNSLSCGFVTVSSLLLHCTLVPFPSFLT